MFPSDVLYAEVVNDKREDNGTRNVAEQAWCVFALVVSVFSEIGDEGVIGNSARLGKTIHALVDLYIDVAFVDEGAKVVKVEDCFRDEGDRDHHELGSGHWSVEIKIFDVHGHEEALGVESTLLKRSLAVRRPAVLVLTSPG